MSWQNVWKPTGVIRSWDIGSAGSKAEFLTGEMLKKEMEEIGLSGVTKDEITVDGWEFRKAVLYVLDENGKKREIRLGAYPDKLRD